MENSRPKQKKLDSSWLRQPRQEALKSCNDTGEPKLQNHEATRTRQPLRDPLPGRFKPHSWYQSKDKLKENPAPPISFKTTAEITGNIQEKTAVPLNQASGNATVEVLQLNSTFLINGNSRHQQTLHFNYTTSNDAVPTNRNDAATLQQLRTNLSRNDQQLSN
ncbi:hypothetical protein F511_17245 [Dorcoceras hygrometricum]|uniref:Uncharacterized protein n=1 Tax=Dorcoceras hygrometricum TaxID=472368 RepID=A0A2Z7AXE2_9LAMI|nr:hypothetical protein F511_17245 [Dorcoceras hygrometricum]